MHRILARVKHELAEAIPPAVFFFVADRLMLFAVTLVLGIGG